jgi:hypothetical protein
VLSAGAGTPNRSGSRPGIHGHHRPPGMRSLVGHHREELSPSRIGPSRSMPRWSSPTFRVRDVEQALAPSDCLPITPYFTADESGALRRLSADGNISLDLIAK